MFSADRLCRETEGEVFQDCAIIARLTLGDIGPPPALSGKRLEHGAVQFTTGGINNSPVPLTHVTLVLAASIRLQATRGRPANEDRRSDDHVVTENRAGQRPVPLEGNLIKRDWRNGMTPSRAGGGSSRAGTSQAPPRA